MVSQMPPPPPVGASDRKIRLNNSNEANLCGGWDQDIQSEDFRLDFKRPHHPRLDSAIRDGDSQNVILELKKARGQSPEARFDTALYRAITLDAPEIALLLINNGVIPTPRNLLAAAAHGQTLVVERILLYLSWPINKDIDGEFILTHAVKHNGLVTWLLRNGAEPNVEDIYAETPLSRAVECGSVDVCHQLLQAGADVRKGAPLQLALESEKDAARSRDLVKRLLALGAPVDQFIGEGSEAWNDTGFERGTALHSACKKESAEVVQTLLDYGANPTFNQRVRSTEIPNTSPLDTARQSGNTEIIAMLEKNTYNSRRRFNL